MVTLMLMDSEGARLVTKLLALDVSVWRISKACGVSYTTGKAWKRGWWSPSLPNTYKLQSLLAEENNKRRGFKY